MDHGTLQMPPFNDGMPLQMEVLSEKNQLSSQRMQAKLVENHQQQQQQTSGGISINNLQSV